MLNGYPPEYAHNTFSLCIPDIFVMLGYMLHSISAQFYRNIKN